MLFLVTDRCAAYCRYCTRSRLVSNASGYDFHPEFDKQIEYIRRTPRVRDVLLSGGDPLLLSDEKLDHLARRSFAPFRMWNFCGSARAFPFSCRNGSRPRLCSMLKKVSSAFHEHSLESSARTDGGSAGRPGRLADAGIPLGNQSVLLRDVNDDLTVTKALVQKLLMCRVKPYYIYQCDLIAGSAHLRASVRKGLKIMEGLRGHTTGYAVPQYVIDAPGGGGKVPVNPEYVLSHNADRVVIRNFRRQNL